MLRMPRTKAATLKPKKVDDADNVMKEFAKLYFKKMYEEAEEKCNGLLEFLTAELLRIKFLIPASIGNKTLGELSAVHGEEWETYKTDLTHSTISLHVTKSTLKKNKGASLRCSSASRVDDGYQTSSSTNSTSGRTSRLRERNAPKTDRMSRSLSRAKALERSTVKKNKGNRFLTPAGSKTPHNFGFVTPKMDPSQPQVLLRRPNHGEVALSMQGSPLFTGSGMGEHVANINIPLADGRVLSVQPQRGLRVSQVPVIDAETTRHMQALRDNLEKLISVASKR